MVRKILAVVAGLAAAIVTFFIVQMISGFIFGLPRDLDMSDKAAVAAFMERMPVGALLVVAFGYALGSFIAGLLARKLSQDGSIAVPVVIGAALTLAWVMNIMMLPHPIWMVILGFLIYIPFTLLGHRVATR